MRKISIGLISLGAVALAFWLYVRTMETSVPLPPKAADANVLTLPQASDAGQTSQTVIHGVQQSRYVLLDPQTKQVRRVLGFEKLLNPQAESSRWLVEKPYLIFYEMDYECRLESDSGVFQVETAGPNAAPKDVRDAQLNGNVVIRVTPRAGSSISQTFVYMDDLTFSSERSEFATDGPVRVCSDQIDLKGFGLVLILDVAKGRIDYLHILDLEQLRLINMAASSASASEGSSSAAAPKNAASDTFSSAVRSPKSSTSKSMETSSQQPDYYQCILDNNVVIHYGSQLVVAGADRVAVQNILLSRIDSTAEKAAGQKEGPVKSADSLTDGQKSPGISLTAPSSADSKNRDIVVLCDGGIILKPMNGADNSSMSEAAPELSIEMNGSPLRIERPSSETGVVNEMLVSCGILKYKPAEDILRLFTNISQPEIVLGDPSLQGRIQTRGNVLWNRKTQQASIGGPGKAFLSSKDSAQEPSEVAFGGKMELRFAEPETARTSVTVQTVNLTGGMNAIFRQNGWYKTAADSAVFEFGEKSDIESAHLEGGVQFESLEPGRPQRAAAKTATLKFGPGNSLTAAYMNGQVRFESLQDSSQSRATAETAVFYFEKDKVQRANLQGDVCVASQTGQLTSSDATIEFSADTSGAVQPAAVHASGNTVLQTKTASPEEPPARFEARRIDYDLQTGSGLAHGPLQFTFYQAAKNDNQALQPWIPITVTAEKNAEFTADTSGSIRQVVFNQNVVAVRRLEALNYIQTDTFHGEKLSVFPQKNKTGSMDIQRINITEGNVFAESLRMHEDVKLSHVKLTCTDITWDRPENLLAAQGPGKIELITSDETPADMPEQTGINFRRPCVAQLVGFDKIRWLLNDQKIVADANQETMQLVYIPLLEKKPERFIYVNSIQFNLDFAADSAGRTMLAKVFTNQGIVYRENNADQTKTLHELIGQTLDYDAQAGGGWLIINGTEANPCRLDGARVPAIRYNLATGQIETSLSTIPGVLRTGN
ncbi:MAG: hypothetical protein KBI46_04210 [Phycisphaerae bacterium]|nr:hypothetical protein [Phycisphaerae bacterium]